MTNPVRPKSSKARHRSRLEARLKKKIYRLKKLGEKKGKVLRGVVRVTERRIEQLKKKLAA